MGSITPSMELTVAWAEEQDHLDPLSRFRSEFHIPTQTDLQRPTLAKSPDEPAAPPSIYLCGNSLGVQPQRTATVIDEFLTQWRLKGVKGHFVEHRDSQLAPWLHIDDHAAKLMAPIVGAQVSEVAVMGTLTGNLHLLMSSFYRPNKEKGRWKIMLEGKAFPSDHFAVESQIQHWGLDPEEAMVLLEPSDPDVPILTREEILRMIDQHAHELALILLPGVQFYTGQLFDIKTITAHAQAKGIIVGWDLAHAAGNVELKLHDWNVDFAAWCTYKYLNCGPGAMGALFVHERYGHTNSDAGIESYWPRLTGWWGDDKSGRFAMTNKFSPRPGAAGFQLSNPSALDLASVVASLQIFNETSMKALRERSIRLTRFLELLLKQLRAKHPGNFTIITPSDPNQRGAQLSVRLKSGMLNTVLKGLEESGVVVDERRPDVVRVAPAPLYNTFADVWQFCRILGEACDLAEYDTPT